jgi:hypothetical protein
MLGGGIGGWSGGIGFSLLSETFQFDLGGLFIHIQDCVDDGVDGDVGEDIDGEDCDCNCRDDIDVDSEGCWKGGKPLDRRGKGRIDWDNGDGDDDDDDTAEDSD